MNNSWMLTSNISDTCMLGLLPHHLKSNLIFSTLTTWTDSISAVEQVWNQFLCLKWNHTLVYMPAGTCQRISISGEISIAAAVNSNSAFYKSLSFCESRLVSLTTYKVWSLWMPSMTWWIFSLCFTWYPFSIMEVAIECLHLVVAKIDVFTWGQSGSAHGRGVRRSSRHRQVVIHVFYLGKHRDVVCLWGDLAFCM